MTIRLGDIDLDVEDLDDLIPPPFVPLPAGATCSKCGAGATRWMDSRSGEIVHLCSDWPDCQPR